MSDKNLPKPPLQKSKTADSDDQGKSFAKNIQQSGLYNAMDDNNKKALDVFAEKGADAAVSYMFTHPESGRQLSYGEMRMLYG